MSRKKFIYGMQNLKTMDSDIDPLAFTEADVGTLDRAAETEDSKCKSSNWPTRVIYKHGKVEVLKEVEKKIFTKRQQKKENCLKKVKSNNEKKKLEPCKNVQSGSTQKNIKINQPTVILKNICESSSPKVIVKKHKLTHLLSKINFDKSKSNQHKKKMGKILKKQQKKKASSSNKKINFKSSKNINLSKKKMATKSTTKKETAQKLNNILKKYKHLLPENDPIVKLTRIKFKSSHYTGEPVRLSSDVNLFRDSAALYKILSHIFQNLNIIDKQQAFMVCKLWSIVRNEELIWKKIVLSKCIVNNVEAMERIILKYETNKIILDNVSLNDKNVTELKMSHLHAIKSITCNIVDDVLMKRLLNSCTSLENVNIVDKNINILAEASFTLKTIIAPNCVVCINLTKSLKNFIDLEKLQIKSFDSGCYKSMGLLLPLKELILDNLDINEDIDNLIENIPNIEYMRFFPNFRENENKLVYFKFIESLKRCPSLKKIDLLAFESRSNSSTSEVYIQNSKEYSNTYTQEESTECLDKSIAMSEEHFDDPKTIVEEIQDSNVEKMDVDQILESKDAMVNLESESTKTTQEFNWKNLTSLKNMSFLIYLKSSLPDCEISLNKDNF